MPEAVIVSTARSPIGRAMKGSLVQVHDFPVAASMLPEAIRSLRQIGEYIREATG